MKIILLCQTCLVLILVCVMLGPAGATVIPTVEEQETLERLEDHRMHSEYGIVSAGAAAAINSARGGGGRIVAVGTTCVRLLESAVDESGIVHPFEGDTDLFITPGWRFRAIDLMMTNFHLPKSTLFALVCAYAGHDRMLNVYQHAIEMAYRFYSYGDACLLSPERQEK